MKLQAHELPLMKNQTRRKTPKIAPLIVLALFLLTIIPIYYPFLRYPYKNSSSISSSSSSYSSRTSFQACLDDSSPENDQCSHKVVEGSQTIGNQDTAATTPKGGDVEEESAAAIPKGGDSEEPPAISNLDGDVEINPNTKSSNLVNSHGRDADTIKPTLSNPDTAEELATDGDRDSATERDGELANRKRQSEWGKFLEREKCNLFSGEWVPNPEGPYYTNATCWAIQEHQDCMKFGRPDTQYLKWRWKPDGCELPNFDPYQFLELVRGKSLAFVGDSVARNHMQSLICLLSRVEEAVDVSEVPYGSQFKRYEFANHNFTVEIFWSPYLVRTTQTDPSNPARPFNLFLDEFDEKWTTKIEPFDYVIISAGHWFFRPTMFYVEGRVVGCLYCPEPNINHLTAYFSYRRAFRTAFRAINSIENFRGITFLRSFAPSHFENGYWDKGGDCVRKRPFRNREARLDGYNLELYKIQLEEIKIAKRLGRRRGLRFKFFDVTGAMLLRPDGHPSKYGHQRQANVSLANDCVHWCLPGPIDTWNDFLLELLMREDGRQLVEKQF